MVGSWWPSARWGWRGPGCPCVVGVNLVESSTPPLGGGLARCWVSETSDPPWFVVVGVWWSWVPGLLAARVCVVVGVGLLFELWIVDASIFVAFLFLCVCFDCCLASCEGRMVDALASRADEGRWSLR